MAMAVPERGWRVGSTSGSGKSGVVSAPHISVMWNRRSAKGQPWLFIGPGHVVVDCAMLLLGHPDSGQWTALCSCAWPRSPVVVGTSVSIV